MDIQLLEQSQSGVDAARNAGVRASHGEYVQYLDSDDVMHPEKLSASIARFRPEVDTVVSRHQEFRDLSEIRERLAAPPADAPFKLSPERRPFYVRMGWELWGPVYRRSLIAASGPMPEGIPAGGAYSYTTRLKLLARGHAYLPLTLMFYRRGSPAALTKLEGATRLPATARVLRCVRDHLCEFAISDRREWKHLFWKALKSYRRCVVAGVTEERDELFSIAREAAWRWNALAGAVLRSPEFPLRLLIEAGAFAVRRRR
jgi:glycosyltransferase involved in cell wall biosynthesis